MACDRQMDGVHSAARRQKQMQPELAVGQRFAEYKVRSLHQHSTTIDHITRSGVRSMEHQSCCRSLQLELLPFNHEPFYCPPELCSPLAMQPIVTTLPASIPASNPLDPDTSPFDSSPQSPTSATTSSTLSSSHRANRPAGQHNLRGVQAVVEEERLYRWRDQQAVAAGREQQHADAQRDGDGRVKGVGKASTLWQRRQQAASRQQLAEGSASEQADTKSGTGGGG